MEGIKVAVRLRPLNKREQDSRCVKRIHVEENVLSISCQKGNLGYRQSSSTEYMNHFTFDKCYVDSDGSSSSSSNKVVCEDISSGMMQYAVNSYNVSLIVFGQKGSGKTFTVFGNESSDSILPKEEDRGILHHLCEKLFSLSNLNSDAISMTRASCLEIYNNQLIDLMHDGTRSRGHETNLHVREHPKNGPFVEGLTKYTAKSYEDLVKTIKSCILRRKVETWDQYNSSRSHVIVGIQYSQASFADCVPSEIRSSIDIVDLADKITDRSPNIKLNKSEAERLNHCLTSFHDVIKSLADTVDRRGTRRKSVYVPFRDSLLTWLLKDSFSGNNVTFMVATISPADSNYNETLFTLQTASRACHITNRPTANVDFQVSKLRDLLEENGSLRSPIIDDVRCRLSVPMKQLTENQKKLKAKEEAISDGIGNWICKWEGISAILSPSAKELVRSWKENQQRWIGSCGTDSAFGSDLEVESESKSVSDEFDKTDDMRSLRLSSSELSPDVRSSISVTTDGQSSASSDFTADAETSTWKAGVFLRPVPVKQRNRELHDPFQTEIKEQINSLKHVEKKSAIVSRQQEPLTPEDFGVTVTTCSEDKLHHRSNNTSKDCVNNTAFIPQTQSPSQEKDPQTSQRNLQTSDSSSSPPDVLLLFSLLSEEFAMIQTRIGELLNQQQSNIVALRKATARLMDDVTRRMLSVEALVRKLKQVGPSSEDPQLYASKLEQCDQLMASMERIFQINQLLWNIESSIQSQQYHTVATSLEHAKLLISAMNMEEEFEHRSCRVLQTELCLVRQRALCQMIETWDRMIRWHIPSRAVLQSTRPTTVSLNLSLLYWQREMAEALIQGMEKMDILSGQIECFCDLLLLHIVQKLVSHQGAVLQIVEEADRYMAHVTSHPSQRKSAVAAPAEVFRKIEQVFQFMDRIMSRIKIVTPDIRETTLMERIGKVISKRLFDAIYSECLSQTLERAGIQWMTFDQIAKATEMFHDTMTQLKLVPADESPLTECLNSVGTHFGQVKSQELLKKAHDFVTSDLSDFQKISVDHPLGVAVEKDGREREEFVKQCKERVRTANYKLPTCQISNPVRSLVCLAYDTLKEASIGSRRGATHLCGSVHGMFELYCDMIPFHHQEKVRTIPLLAALHHNNCMFVAHHLITIDKVFRRELLPLPDPSGENPAGSQTKPQLGALVSKIRRLGNQDFGEHVELKQKEMCDNLNDADGFSCVADDDGLYAMRAVREMIHQLTHISLTWRDVLPTNIYCRAIGSLLNSALKDIIDSVTTIEEFSIEDCQYLQKVLSYILDSVKDLFPSDVSKTKSPEVTIQENVSSWMKFRQLVLFLGFSLVDITDQWAGGKGPLAMHFTSGEVVRLVVGMFENTSRRYALLTELKKNPSVYKV